MGKLTKRPERGCFTCRHWSGVVKGWHEVGETRGTCLWLANLAVTHAAAGVPDWVSEKPPVRVMHDDDGDGCTAWTEAGRSALDQGGE
jgi:hypothetical protein